MSKLKFVTKLNEENEYKKPYSPTNEINDMEIEEHVPRDEPSSPVSITFDVEKLPFQDDDINEENFLPPRTSSPISPNAQGKYNYYTFCQNIFPTWKYSVKY